MFNKQSISLLHMPFKYKNKLYMASRSYNRNFKVMNFTIFIYIYCVSKNRTGRKFDNNHNVPNLQKCTEW